MARLCLPACRPLAVADVDTEAVLQVLRPIWTNKKETALLSAGGLEAILNAAKAEGLRIGENPAASIENMLRADRS